MHTEKAQGGQVRWGNCDRTLGQKELSGRVILTLELTQKCGCSFRVIRVLLLYLGYGCPCSLLSVCSPGSPHHYLIFISEVAAQMPVPPDDCPWPSYLKGLHPLLPVNVYLVTLFITLKAFITCVITLCFCLFLNWMFSFPRMFTPQDVSFIGVGILTLCSSLHL